MQFRLPLLTIAAAALFTTVAPAAEDAGRKRLKIGAKAAATDVEMKGTDGKTWTIDQVRGQHGTLVLFSCNSCPVVVGYEERIARILNDYAAKGIGVIAINSNDVQRHPKDDMDAMKARAKERGFRFPYVIDSTSDVARTYGATKTPEVFLFDSEMKLVYHGAIDDSPRDAGQVEKHYLTAALDALIAGEEIEEQETVAVGCTIKFRPETAKPEQADGAKG